MKKKNTVEINKDKPQSFSERVLRVALRIPPGRVTTYGRVALAAGGTPILSRSITSILSKMNKDGKLKIPYHRIVYADGSVWMDEEYGPQRRALYKKEGIELTPEGKIKNFKEILI